MVTGSDGAFTFAHLPPGRYRMRAEKPGFVTREHGQGPTADDAGAAVTLGDGQHLRDVDIVLPKGSVVSGRVRDADGEPVAEALVRLSPAQGVRTISLMTPSVLGTRTDDRGYYRVPAVPAGIYVVEAELTVLPQPIGASRQGVITFARSSQGPATPVDVPAGTDVEGVDLVAATLSRP
jgi:hypothetical protein